MRLGLAARLQVVAGTVAGMQRTHLQQAAHTAGAHRVRHGVAQFDVHLAEALAVVAAFVEDADEIDHRVGIGEGFTQERRVMHIACAMRGPRRHALARRRITREHAHAIPVREQTRDQPLADEAAAAEDDDAPAHRRGVAAPPAGGTGQTNCLRVSTSRPARRSVTGSALPLSRQS